MDDVNTDISSYTVDELFGLLDVNIKTTTTYEELVDKVKKNTDQYIKIFTQLNKPSIVLFFKNVQEKLLYSNKQNPKKDNVVITYNNDYKYGSDMLSASDSDGTFNKNIGSGTSLDRKTITKIYSVDSRFRTNYTLTTSTNFGLEIPEDDRRVIEMRLCDIELPTSYYVFNDAYNNNYFWLKVVFVTGTRYIYVYVPQGNYSPTRFIQTLNTAIQQFTGFENIVVSHDLTNVNGINEGTGLVSFTFTDVNITSIEVNFNAPSLLNQTSTFLLNVNDPLIDVYLQISTIPLIQRLAWLMGFRNSLYTSTNTIISESILDIFGPRYLYLLVDDHRMGVNSDFKVCNVGNIPGTILARISIKNPPFSIQTEYDLSVYAEPRYYYGPVNVKKLDIRLLDEFGRIINLNGCDFSFTLRLTIMYSAT
jgi:hypothetical protein